MPLNQYNIPFSQPTTFDVSSSASNTSNCNENVPVTCYKYTYFKARVNNPDPRPSPLNTAGIPGTNYIGSDFSTPVFSQGEDFIFDSYLFINGQCINTNQYELSVVLKATQYSLVTTWTGTLGNGIYADIQNKEHFVIFIPKVIGSTLIAGTFELDVVATETVNSNNDIKPRTLLVGKTFFDVEYSAFSPDPETLQTGGNERYLLPPSYPPVVNII